MFALNELTPCYGPSWPVAAESWAWFELYHRCSIHSQRSAPSLPVLGLERGADCWRMDVRYTQVERRSRTISRAKIVFVSK